MQKWSYSHSQQLRVKIYQTLLMEIVDHFMDEIELSGLHTELGLFNDVMASMEFTYPKDEGLRIPGNSSTIDEISSVTSCNSSSLSHK